MATTPGLDEAGLKVLQLECIISSKDKEISLLREQLSHDQEELIKHLQEENEALKRQLQQQGPAGISSPTRQANGTSSRGAAAGHDSVVELNVSGTILTTTLSALQQVPGSKLASLVGGGNPQQQQLLDSQGRLFLPFEASAFSSLLSLLQASSVFGRASPAFTALLRQHAPTSNPYLQELIQHLRLNALLNPAAHGSSGHNAAAAATSSSHGPISGGSGAAVLRALGEAQGRPDSRGRAAVLSSSDGGGGGGSSGGAGRQRRSSSPTGLLHGAGSGQGGAGAGHRGRGGPSHQHHGHERHERHEKQQQDKTPDPAAAAAAAASAAAAQSAAMQALTMRPAAQGSGGGAAHDTSNVSNMPADLVASAALKGLVQGPKGVAG